MLHFLKSCSQVQSPFTPTEASNKKNGTIVYENLFDDIHPAPIRLRFINVGDRVRIITKKAFYKGYTSRWTEEVFTISKQQHTRPPTFRYKITMAKIFKARFVNRSFKRQLNDIYRIEKVIKRKANKVLVKGRGYPEKFNSWVNKG